MPHSVQFLKRKSQLPPPQPLDPGGPLSRFSKAGESQHIPSTQHTMWGYRAEPPLHISWEEILGC